MALTLDQANALLDNVTTEADLRNLISQLDVTATGKVTMLYSGDVGGVKTSTIINDMIASGADIRVIDNTEAAKFLNVKDNPAFKSALERITNSSLADPNSAAYQFLDGGIDASGKRIPNGAWDDVSGRFAAATTGEVRSLTGAADATRIFAQTELPALLNNPSITSINGVATADLVRLKNDLQATGLTDIVASGRILDYVNNTSAEQGRALILAKDASGNLIGIGTKDYFTKIGLAGTGADLPAGMSGYPPLIQQTPDAITNAKLVNDRLKQYAQEGVALAEASGDATRIAGARSYLSKFGFVGDVLDVGLMAKDAVAAFMAGNTDAAQKIVADWAIGAASSGAASAAALAAFNAYVATSGLNLAGPLGSATNFAIAAIAGVAGGIYGPEVVSDLLNTLTTNNPDSGTIIDGNNRVTRFDNGVVFREPLSGTGTSTDPYMLPEVVVTATRGTWTIPNGNGSVTEIKPSTTNDSFTIEQKSSNAPGAIVLRRGDITIDAGGVHNTTRTENGWTTVTTDPVTKQVISNSTAVVQPDETVVETVTYTNGRVVRITEKDGNKTVEVVPTAMEKFVSTTATLIDALTLIKAIQTGEPLPVLTSGLRLINDINALNGGAPNYSLSGAASVGSSILSVMSLDAALKRGDTLGAITAGAQALGAGVQAYVSFATANNIAVSSSVQSWNTTLNGTPNVPGPSVIGVLNLVNAIANDDPVGAAMAAISMTPAAPIAYAYYAFQLVSSIFGNNSPPEAWGSASATWSGFNAQTNATGAYGGLETATQTYNGVLTYLDQLVNEEQKANPGSPIGIVANRLPSLSYRNYTGYSITDIDPLTGEQRNPGVLYDLTGRPYNAPAGSVQASQSLSERMIRVALERGAVAPLWEVQTAALQTQAGDPMAGLTEEERAGRAGMLFQQPSPLAGSAPLASLSPPAGEGNQIFRAVALDLNGDGVQTTGTARTAAFDVDDSGYLKNTAWLSNGDGFLFLDRNLNGQIDGGKELFSNATVALSERGLAGMRWIDSNYDGSLSALDPVWNELKVWQDASTGSAQAGNGVVDAGEIKTLAQLGITSLNYAMGTFERNGQLSELSSPDLAADTRGTITYTVPEGIIVQTSNGHTSLLATRIDDKSAIEANRDGVTGYEDTELIISAADLMANDTLAGFSGQNLSVAGVSNFAHGTGFLDTNGFIHYTPDANYFGAANDAVFEGRRAA